MSARRAPGGRAGAKDIWVGLGANAGNRRRHMGQAKLMLARFPDVELVAASSLYETEPVGLSGQPRFLNAVVGLRSAVGLGRLLAMLREVELRLGRRRDAPWGARTIDCDLLLMGSDAVVHDDLVVPHPELVRRAFVLAPLVEVAPSLRHPVTGLPLAYYLEQLGLSGVRRMEGVKW